MQVHLSLACEDQTALTRAAKEMDVKRLALNPDEAVKGEQRQLVTEFYMRCAELKARARSPQDSMGAIMNAWTSNTAAAWLLLFPFSGCVCSIYFIFMEFSVGQALLASRARTHPIETTQECVRIAQRWKVTAAQAGF